MQREAVMERMRWNKSKVFHAIIIGYLVLLTIGNILSFQSRETELTLRNICGVITGIVFFYAGVFLTLKESDKDKEYRIFVSWMFWGMGLNAMSLFLVIWLKIKVPAYTQFGFYAVWCGLIAYGFSGFLIGLIFGKIFRLAALKSHLKGDPAQMTESAYPGGKSILPDSESELKSNTKSGTGNRGWLSYVIPVCFVIMVSAGNIICMIKWEIIWGTGGHVPRSGRESTNFFAELIKWVPYFWSYVWRSVGCCFFFGLAVFLCLNQSPVKWRRYVGLVAWGIGGNGLILYYLRVFGIVHTTNYLLYLYEFLIPYGLIAFFAGTVTGLIIRRMRRPRRSVWAKP